MRSKNNLNNKKLYFISGLGADHRAFQKLDLAEFELHHLEWLTQIKDESISSYASRMSQQIESNEPVILGLSFGGIIAVEILKYKPQSKLILISSAKTKFEIPWIYRMIGTLRLNKIIPPKLLKSNKWILVKLFGVNDKEAVNLLKNIINDTDAPFLKWAIDKILNWDNMIAPYSIIHIHGSNDRVLPYSNISNAIMVKGGGHFMVFDKSDEVSALIKQYVN